MKDITLQDIFNRQKNFQKKFNNESDNIEEISKQIHFHSQFVVEEIYEMLRELPFHKPWKDYSDLTEEEIKKKLERAREEWIDVFIFLINSGVYLGFDEHLVTSMYLEKNKLNNKRQEDPELGYVK